MKPLNLRSFTVIVPGKLAVMSRPIQPLAERAIEYFEEDLSWNAISRQAVTVYRELVGQRAGRKS